MLPARLGTYFTLAEVQRVSDPIPAQYEENVRRSIAALDQLRAVIGVPFVLTSGYRTPERNARVGGSATTDHDEALAWDFVPQGITLHEFYRRFRAAEAAGKLPAFDQVVLYPYTAPPRQKHVHAGFGARMRRQHLLRNGEEQERETGREYMLLTSLSQLPKVGAVSGVVLVVLAAVALFFLFSTSTR